MTVTAEVERAGDRPVADRHRRLKLLGGILFLGSIFGSLIFASFIISHAVTEMVLPKETQAGVPAAFGNQEIGQKHDVATYGHFLVDVPVDNITTSSVTNTITYTAVNLTTVTIAPVVSVADVTGSVGMPIQSANMTSAPVAESVTFIAPTVESVVTATSSGALSTVTVTETIITFLNSTGTYTGQNVTDYGQCTVVSSTADALTHSMDSVSTGNQVSGTPMTGTLTVLPSPTETTSMAVSSDSLAAQDVTSSVLPTITLTTTIDYPVSYGGAYAGTETVTVTPEITTTELTTVSLPSVISGLSTATYTSAGNVMVSVFTPGSTAEATSDTTTTTIMQTVIPIPASETVTEGTDSFTTSSIDAAASMNPNVTGTMLSSDSAMNSIADVSTTDSVVAASTTPTIVTTILTSTVMGKGGNLTSAMGTLTTYTTTYTIAPGSINASWTQSAAPGNISVEAFTVAAWTVTGTSSSGLGMVKSTDSATMDQMATTTSAVNDAQPTQGEDKKSGASMYRKPYIPVWGSKGFDSGSCVVMVIIMASMFIQAFIL